MNRLDSEYVYKNTLKHINWRISMKRLYDMYKVDKIHSCDLYKAYKRILLKDDSFQEITDNDIDEFLTSLKLNSKKSFYTKKEKRKLYIHLLVKTCVRFTKSKERWAQS